MQGRSLRPPARRGDTHSAIAGRGKARPYIHVGHARRAGEDARPTWFLVWGATTGRAAVALV